MKLTTFKIFNEILLSKYNIYIDISYIIYEYAKSIELIEPIIRIELYFSLYTYPPIQDINLHDNIWTKINSEQDYTLNIKLTYEHIFHKCIKMPNIILKHHKNLIDDYISYLEMKIDEIINLFHEYVDIDMSYENYSMRNFTTSNGTTKVLGKICFDYNKILIKYEDSYYSIKRLHICSYKLDAHNQDNKYIVFQIEFDLYDDIVIDKNIYSSYIFAVIK